MMLCEVEKDSEGGSFERYGKMKIKACLSMCVCVCGYKRLDYTHGKHFLTQKKCCIVTQD